MKISVKKSKLIIYLVIGYLIATWGVNHVVNPIIYVKNICEKATCQVEQRAKEDEIILTLSESVKTKPYVCFCVPQADEYSIRTNVIMKDAEGTEISQSDYIIEKGSNWIKIEEDGVATVCLKGEILRDGIVIQECMQMDVPKVNVFKSLEVFVSFWIFILFWECIQFIKQKYAK